MTSGTIDREAEEGLPDTGGEIFEFVLPGEQFHPLAASNHSVVHSGDKEPRCCCTFASGQQLVAEELQADELVIGHVAVQRVDDPVTVGPGRFARPVTFEPVAFPEANDIEPVPAPAFAVAG